MLKDANKIDAHIEDKDVLLVEAEAEAESALRDKYNEEEEEALLTAKYGNPEMDNYITSIVMNKINKAA